MFDRVFNKIGDMPIFMERKKILKYYKNVLREKKENIDAVKWSSTQTKEYNEFWKTNYGYIPDERHNKYFEGINGMYNYQYIPRPLYNCVIEPRLNPYKICRIYSQKNLQYNLFSCISDLHVPKCIGYCFNGNYVINGIIVSKSIFISECKNIGAMLIKPSYWTSSGKGVRQIDICDGIDKITKQSVETIVNSYGRDFTIQEIIKPSKEIGAISLKSLNTFRVTTFICDGAVHCSPIAFRIGVGNSITDNESTGGYCIGVTKDGRLRKTAYQYEAEDSYMYLDKHPETGIEFENYYVADIEKLNYVAKKMHSVIPNLGICSWDLTIDENDVVSFIELNAQYQGIDMNQVASGEPLFGELTSKMLNQFYGAKL